MPDKAERTWGWQSGLPEFRDTSPKVIRTSLEDFIRDASREQVRAWDQSIPLLQREAAELLDQEKGADQYTAILEYRLPLESRRPDCIVLLLGPVVVVEMKGKSNPSQADIDQAAAYARDLRAYHRECADRPVHAVLVPTRASNNIDYRDGVHIVGPGGLDALLRKFPPEGSRPLKAAEFLREDAYRPLPTLVQAARELLESKKVRQIWRASSDTDKAVAVVTRIAHDAAASNSRHLVLLTGVPGSGKTLVGLRIVHAPFLDDLAVDRGDGRPAAPAIFLSGNGPLVEVLQHLLKGAGGGGKTFVRGVKDYLDAYAPRSNRVPPEHVIIFDEAQRAFDPEAVAKKHKKWKIKHKSEPSHFVEIAERIPGWCVLVGVIGTGQEIHVGEEAGIVQWRDAILECRSPRAWTIHAPATLQEKFEGSGLSIDWEPSLNLNTEVRFHLAADLHEWLECLLERQAPDQARRIEEQMHAQGYRLLMSRNLDALKEYAHERYGENPDARFGLLASAKDKDLESFGVPNGWLATKNVRLGAWYAAEGEQSCKLLTRVITEFGAQGLELDFAIVCWGTDFARKDGKWSNEKARGYRKKDEVKDPFRLRLNSYRVLMTRGRDGTAIFVPPLKELDETYTYLRECGCRELS